MNIVLLESLGIPAPLLESYASSLKNKGHTFESFERSADPAVQIEHAKDAHALIIANMPLSKEVISSLPKLQFIDIAFTGVDHVALDEAKKRGIKVSNAAGYSTQAVAELAVCMMLSLLETYPKWAYGVGKAGQKKDWSEVSLAQRLWVF